MREHSSLQQEKAMQPTLYIVATPIGTAADLSPRAREVLGSVGFVACEDTRHSQKLLKHLKIEVNALKSLHEHNEDLVSQALIRQITDSPPYSAAIITDAGTPCISDPGARFVSAARTAGIRICSVPGPSALPTALAASGFLQPRSVFSQFLPRPESGQCEEFARWQSIAPCIAVFFESPQRILKTLTYLQKHFGTDIEVCVSRELSKLFEEHISGKLSEVLNTFNTHKDVRGEFVVCVNIGPDYVNATPVKLTLTLEEAAQKLKNMYGEVAIHKDEIKAFAQKNNLSAKELYNYLQRLKA